MFKTNPHIFVHMPRTGGTWVRHFLPRSALRGQDMDTYMSSHAPATQIKPEDREGRLVWGTIRNPWDWYLSIYQYAMAHQEEVERLQVYGSGSTEFKAVIRGMTHPTEDTVPMYPAVIWRMYLDKHKRPGGRAAFIGAGCGLWSWVVQHMYGADPVGHLVDALIDTNHLYQGIPQLLGLPVSPEGFPVVNDTSARPVSRIENPRSLYDAESIEWVRQADGKVMEALGYSSVQAFMPHPLTVIQTRQRV